MSFYQVSGGAAMRVTRKVTYQCENCGREFSYFFNLESVRAKTVGVTGSSGHDKVRAELEKELSPEVIEELNKEVKALTESKNYGYEKCPGCGYTQSWMLGAESSAQASKNIFKPWILITMVLVALTIIIIAVLNKPDFPYLVCLVSFVLWALVTFMTFKIGAKKLHDPNEKFGVVERKNTPDVVWSNPKKSELTPDK